MTRTARSAIGAVLGLLPEALPLTLLAALPAFLNLASERIFEEEKALLLRAAAVLALPGLVFAWRAYPARMPRHPVVVTFAALIVVLLLAALAGVDRRTAIEGAYVKRHGMLTWFALAIAFAGMCGTASSTIGRTRLLTAAVLGSIWPAAYALLQHAGADPVQWIGASAERAVGTLGSPNFLGGYLAIVVPLTILRARSARWPSALVPLQLAAIAATASRGSIVALAAGTLGAGLAYTWRLRGGRVFAAGALALGLAATSAMIALPALRPAPLDRFFDARSGSGRVRVLIWNGVADLMRNSGGRLWIGYGPESLHGLFPPYYSAEIGVLDHNDAMPDRAHNETLDMFVSAGVFGAGVELALFAAIIGTALRAADAWPGAALVAAAIAHVVEIQLGIATVVSRLVFLGVAALVVGVNHEPAPPEAARASAPSRIGAKKHHGAPPNVDELRPDRAWRWLSAAALTGALSPWLATLTTPASALAGNGSQLVDYLSRVSYATPLMYAAMFALALGLARSMAMSARSSTAAGPWLVWGTLAAATVTMPLAITPSRADIFSKAGAQFESRQQWGAAAVAYGEAVHLQPNEAYYYAGWGRALLQDAVRLEPVARAARLRASRDAFEHARALDPSDLDHTRHLASLARVEASTRVEGREAPLAEADRLYAEATSRAPGLTPLWIEWAWVDADRQGWPQALEKVDRALTLSHDRADAWALRGHIHAALARRRDALADYDAALARDPGNADALRGRSAIADVLPQ